jgi:RNA polymerase sigma factor (sigma-70 family)
LLDRSTETDADLVTAFAASRDGAAFAELVRRHGPMVLGVCQRILGSRHDAEDAFQITFALLASKAAEVRPREQVGPWLYGVARRTALKARGNDARRRALHARIEVPAAVEGADSPPEGLREILDEELARLPEKYLAPVVLCDLEGRTYRTAARELNVPVGTLSNRLAAAHRLLAGRLARRGVAPCGGLAAALALAGGGAAPVSETLFSGVVKACTAAAGGSSFTRGVLNIMLMSNLLKAVAALAVTFSLAMGAVHFLAPAAEDKDAKELEGEWTVVEAERGGKKASKDQLGAMKVTIKRGVLTIQAGAGRKEEADLLIDSSTTPKSIDLTPAKGREKEQGIYKIDKGRLTICWGAAKPGERQRDFTTTPSGGGRLLVLERVKAKGS